MFDQQEILGRLNDAQREAVVHSDGPLLILAGAGSGKTRVITHRIAWLIAARGAQPRDIVAVTFTNKAAGEMRERIENRLGRALTGAFIGTFHALGLRILRANAIAAGYPPGFVIYDTTDQLALTKAAIKKLGVDDKAYPPRQVLTWISRTKNELIDPGTAAERARFPNEKVLASCYREYEDQLQVCSAMDFDDLLVRTVLLFRRHPEIAERYARRTRWLLVDEYQDTNPLQYALIRHLAAVHGNVCCVGDEDQSIYSFRGADIRNILDFTRDFADARIVKLEQNYRSTGTILAAASKVIANNAERHDKTLWTENPGGRKIIHYAARDDREEADFVVESMLALRREEEIPLEEMAVLYRTNATSRLFEDRLTSRGIHYRIFGSLRFYDRKEIKDLLAWLRLLAHPDSDQDFLRAAATPPRGLGAKTLEGVGERATEWGCSRHEAARRMVDGESTLTARARGALQRFLATLADLREVGRGLSTAAWVTAVIDAVGLMEYLERAYPADHTQRAENIDALVSAAEEHDEAGAPDGLAGFLDRVSLRSDTDDVQGQNGPCLMTIHAAKGLEFDVVFIAALNEDLFPHARARHENGGLEEERRLMYVAMTRARKRLLLTSAHFRRQYGEPVLSRPSLFLGEIPRKLLEERGSARREDLPRARPGGALAGVPRRESRRTPAAGTARPRGGELHFEPDPAAGDDSIFRRGMQVHHPGFGRGRILEISGRGQRLTLDIRFERAGRKRIMPHYTTLQPCD